jgi:hypothetical protein
MEIASVGVSQSVAAESASGFGGRHALVLSSQSLFSDFRFSSEIGQALAAICNGAKFLLP